MALIVALAVALVGSLLWRASDRVLERFPGLPERLPVSMQGWLAHIPAEPAWSGLPLGPVLADAKHRGVLVVGVRAYPRPAPSGAPTPPEPDAFDVELANFIAGRLGVRLQVVGLAADRSGGALQPPSSSPSSPSSPSSSQVDLILAGTPGAAQAFAPLPATVPAAYTGGTGHLVVLRGSPYRHAADLAGKPVCMALGSPYARGLAARDGVAPRIYESGIHAVSAFMAGECQALAEDGLLLDRLLGLPEWRFYRPLDNALAADNDTAQIALRAADDTSSAWLGEAVRYWKIGGSLAQARVRRAADVGFEVGQLQNGFVCHS